MRAVRAALLLALIPACLLAESEPAAGPENYIFFNVERERIEEPAFLEADAIVGAQLKYTWRELEPERDRHELAPVLADLRFLQKHGKRLFLQIQDVSFDERINVPDYLIEDPEFGGGVARKYEIAGGEGSAPVFSGWIARRWDPTVIARFEKLLMALGTELDGEVAGVTLPETAVDFGEGGELDPEGFTPESYAAGVKAIMTAAGRAFSRSQVIQYANFMPGEWLPWEDKGYLRGVYEHAAQVGVGVGGPDLLPHRQGQQNHTYKLIAERGRAIKAGLAVQWGNLEDIHPRTGERVTVRQLHAFAEDTLRLDYIFWGTQEPFYSDEVLPFLRRLSRVELP